jgi:Microsomal signal peptidase 25 kDa subunit (SPC25)
VPIYHLDVQTTEKGGKVVDRHIEAPFTRWFTEDGQFVAAQFQSWLAAEVPVVKEALKAKK